MMDKKKRWGNSGEKGHGVNSPAMMEARAGFAKKVSHDKALTKMAGKGNVLKGKNLEGKKK